MREAMPREKSLMRLKITGNARRQSAYRTEQAFVGSNGNPGGTTPLTKANNTKLFSVLAYFSVLWLVGLLADPDNPKVRFHVNQGNPAEYFLSGVQPGK